MMRFLLRRLFLASLFLTITAYGVTMQAIENRLHETLKYKLPHKNATAIRTIYRAFNNRPIWIDHDHADNMSALIRALENPLFNYKDKPFDLPSIKKLLYYLDNNRIDPSKRAAIYARLDVMLTNSFLRLARFIVESDVDWDLVQQKLKTLREKEDIPAVWEMRPKRFKDIDGMIEALQSHRINAYLTSLIPMERRYRSLIDLLRRYRHMDRFPKIDYGETLRYGSYSPRIGKIKRRLQITGDFPKNGDIDNTYDKPLYRAVVGFQKRHLLEPNGIIDNTFIWYLNRPRNEKIRQIIVNLDKTKLYPKRFENEYVEVNVPDFTLRYYRNDRRVFKTGVVVGRIDRPTPIFDDKIEYVVLNPTWTITDNLVKRDLIPVLQKNPNYLEEHNIHVFRGRKEVTITPEMLLPYQESDRPVPYRFVQFPGENNALGRIKFMFPNRYSVYLHDTDNKALLSRRYKVYSSGCMRVDRPFKLAEWILRHASRPLTQEEIDAILATNKPTTIRLKTPIPIHIVYFTVYQEEGISYFKYDIYLYDKIIEESTSGYKKATFTVPKNRLKTVKKKAPQALPSRR